MRKYTEGPVKVDELGGYLFARSVGSACMEENEFMLAQVRGWGHLKYLGADLAAEIQDGNLRRLAAAWNAVQGIPTEEIQPMAEENARLRHIIEDMRLKMETALQISEQVTRQPKGE